MSLGHPAYRAPEMGEGPEHAGKADTNRNRLDGDPQDPHDKVKATLLEP